MSLAYEEGVEFDASGSVKVRVPAKINLHLGCGPLRPDGFHDLTTVYQAISLYDDLHVMRADDLTLTIEGEGAAALPVDEGNLAIRAVQALAAHTGHEPLARLHLTKHIPVAGGLAGGSADAAAALVACDALWGTGLSRDELAKIAADLGSDVPFLILGGTALGTGRGEQVNPVLAGGGWHWVVAVADGGLSTPEVYREIDRLRDLGIAPRPAGPPDQLLAALRQHDPAVLAAALVNDLQAAAISLRPQLRNTLRAGKDEGALAALVSGSGPTCLFLAESSEHASLLATRLTGRGVCRTVRLAHGPVPGARVFA
ncbi:4-(cytidine 5'-diphospho)-2-C-methyl-D-erythritol kinase [Longispora albida]|uniref:4-(cytidine 5'-diphospho)-2-C-methyl-D-erythritol kinase n=1 Tax=Longispora albida TaxID=203523 RepID=UPI000369D42D|nr:4-(cytidine 5'-diphospho)-2-C-methyl-D-erythritol kinase [Longispora albida]